MILNFPATGIDKIITAHQFPDEPSAIIYERGSSAFTKTAYATNDELQQTLREIIMDPKYAYVLLNALGSGEAWHENSNGDYFEESELLPSDPSTGYKTFKSHGNVFMHHVNRDPSKASGQVPGSFWNPVMHRVELLTKLPIDQHADVLSRVERGDPVGVSMGTRIAWDECSWCGNKARVKAEYCDHIRNQLMHVREDGRVCYMINKQPVFFDISIVRVPADKTAWMLAKVAADGSAAHDSYSTAIYSESVLRSAPEAYVRSVLEKCASIPDSVRMAEIAYNAPVKSALIRKVSDIDKIIEGSVNNTPGLAGLLGKFHEKMTPLRQDEAEIPSATLDELAEAFSGDTGGLLATLAAYGVVLKPREYQRLILGSMGEAPRALRDQLDESDATFETVEPHHYPEDRLEMEGGDIDHDAIEDFSDAIAQKSYHRGGLLERDIPEHVEDEPVEIPESLHDHEPLLSRLGGAFEDYTHKATHFAREVAALAAHMFPDTDLTIRLGIAPSLGHDVDVGPSMVAMGATPKEAAAKAFIFSDAGELKKLAHSYAEAGQFLRAPATAIDAMILQKLGII